MTTFHHLRCRHLGNHIVQQYLRHDGRNGSAPVHATLHARQSSARRLGSYQVDKHTTRSSSTTAHSTANPTSSQSGTPRTPTTLTRKGRRNLGSYTRCLHSASTRGRLRAYQQESCVKNHHWKTCPALGLDKHFPTHPSERQRHRPSRDRRPLFASRDQ